MLDLCSVRVKLSAITDVNIESIHPNIPSTNASSNITRTWSWVKFGNTILGRETSIAPIRWIGSPPIAITDTILININAMSWGGMFFLILAGVKNSINNVMANKAISIVTVLESNVGNAIKVPITPPPGELWPKAGASCKMIRINPIPDIKPETTE